MWKRQGNKFSSMRCIVCLLHLRTVARRGVSSCLSLFGKFKIGVLANSVNGEGAPPGG